MIHKTIKYKGNDEVLTLRGGTGVHAGSETTNIVTDITADDTMSFLLNDNIASFRVFKQLRYFPQVELL